ncbi:alpha/beta fold hydrolase [Xanthobacter tagetidis]|uniref:Alpha/beta hydrolase n=1 Tax=Xanthobacter tagetidis TaxID=60216 RepID=A0A3L7A699_9HYPH|nr:alpha/beta hydrolase [Xanthobacter tagetidis]MBB6307285.1 pimeloyl-ACP methyl ester carboxylesterase [Xanthobacter tagetidis]RLP75829.1 alpha/beta hydrolase [Xanthobacter tagetidis]
MSDTGAPAPQTLSVTTPDGLSVAASVWEAEGPPTGPDLLFIHGFSQCGLCWDAQVASPQLAHLRRATYDFRGHGASDKPLDAAFYQEAGRWAGELAAVIAQTGLRRPVLVGWSYAGRIICDYLAAHGAGDISGIVFVAGVVSNEKRFFGTCNRLMRQMCSPDTATNVAATRAFLRSCFARAPERDAFETLLGFNMMVPAEVRAGMFGRPADFDGLLAGLDLPVLAVQGARDIVVAPAMAEHIAATVPGARLEMFAEAGHAPFLETPEAFNAALARFAAAIAPR